MGIAGNYGVCKSLVLPEPFSSTEKCVIRFFCSGRRDVKCLTDSVKPRHLEHPLSSNV